MTDERERNVVVAASFVTENPETSSPGFAFLLATIATYGDGWEDYWQLLAEGGVTVESGWEDAYYGQFVAGGSGGAVAAALICGLIRKNAALRKKACAGAPGIR